MERKPLDGKSPKRREMIVREDSALAKVKKISTDFASHPKINVLDDAGRALSLLASSSGHDTVEPAEAALRYAAEHFPDIAPEVSALVESSRLCITADFKVRTAAVSESTGFTVEPGFLVFEMVRYPISGQLLRMLNAFVANPWHTLDADKLSDRVWGETIDVIGKPTVVKGVGRLRKHLESQGFIEPLPVTDTRENLSWRLVLKR